MKNKSIIYRICKEKIRQKVAAARKDTHCTHLFFPWLLSGWARKVKKNRSQLGSSCHPLRSKIIIMFGTTDQEKKHISHLQSATLRLLKCFYIRIARLPTWLWINCFFNCWMVTFILEHHMFACCAIPPQNNITIFGCFILNQISP